MEFGIEAAAVGIKLREGNGLVLFPGAGAPRGIRVGIPEKLSQFAISSVQARFSLIS